MMPENATAYVGGTPLVGGASRGDIATGSADPSYSSPRPHDRESI
jgi:hypothetical protein